MTTLANLKPFAIGDTTFRAYVSTEGCYVWASDCGRFRAWRTGRRYEASCDGAKCGGDPHDLKHAMSIAIQRAQRRAA